VTPTSNSGNMQYIYQSPDMQTQDYDVPPTHPNARSDNYDTPPRLNESSFDQVDYDTPPQQKFYQQKMISACKYSIEIIKYIIKIIKS
jgi:hypothetical protein